MDAFILGSQRVPFTKSFTHYKNLTTEQLMLASLKALVSRYALQDVELGDVALGAVVKSSFDWNLSRECVLKSGLSPYTPGYDLTRACGTSLEAANHMSLKIKAGQIASGIAAGVDTNSDFPVTFSRKFQKKIVQIRDARSTAARLAAFLSFRPGDLTPQFPGMAEPRTKLSMGQHTELMVKEWGITREAQDALTLKSHQNAAKAQAEGFFNDLITPLNGLEKDSLVRADTTLEKLAKLKPAFDKTGSGSLTAGNSSAMSDGSAAVLMGNEAFAKQRGLTPLAKFIDCEASAVDFVHGDGLLMAPTIAVQRLIKRNNMKLQDFDFYEIHEAFAGQVLCTLKAWESEVYCQKYMGVSALGSIDLSKMNMHGGSVATGHPFAATGARIIGSLSKTLSGKKAARGLISICTAGGMGVAAIIEGV